MCDYRFLQNQGSIDAPSYSHTVQSRDEWPLGPERPRGKCHCWPLCTLCTSNQHTFQMSSTEDFWLKNFRWNIITGPELKRNMHIRCTLQQFSSSKKFISLRFKLYIHAREMNWGDIWIFFCSKSHCYYSPILDSIPAELVKQRKKLPRNCKS